MAQPTDPQRNAAPEDQKCQRLQDLCGNPMDTGSFLLLAVSITSALADLHRENLTHGKINPATILIDSASGAVRLAGPFGASHFYGYPAAEEVALPYMSPEQTGRLNLAVDQRSDLYSLGVTFYQLLSGTLPCEARDVLEWVHCHIAHPPRPLSSQVPPQLVDIVMKLLSKNAQERYQSAEGLQWDLERCLRQWQESETIDPFPLGEKDIPERLLIPQKLYGRGEDLRLLLQVFNDVVAWGKPKFLLVAGYSGIGKSSLVRQLYQPVLQERGYFISGKFDQYRRNVPYSTISQAFRQLIRHILSEREESLARWRAEISRAVGLNGQLLIDIIPELEHLIGKQPPVPPLAPADAKNRFHFFLRRFVSVFARSEHPLVIFLDDLQWPDVASLNAVHHIVSHPDTRHLLVIGAYRANEVSPSHPLMTIVSEMEGIEALLTTITLTPLSTADLGRLLADTFAADEESIGQLTRVVHEKTGGNPFFVVQFLKALHEEGLVRFNARQRLWEWDVAAIGAKSYTDNLAEFMVGRLKKLPEPVLQELTVAACIGNRFDLRTVSLISARGEQELSEAMAAAVREGLLLPVDDGYLFLHDRIQEAAYAMVPEEERPALHLRIGRTLLSSLPAEEVEERILDVVNQLNLGENLVEAPQERERLAELNLAAAQRVKEATAYTAALHYLGMARLFVGEALWQRHDLGFAMELLQAECEFLTGELEPAKERLALLMPHTRTVQESSAVTCLNVDVVTTEDGREDAVAAGLAFLQRVGIAWPPHPPAEEVRQKFQALRQALAEREMQELLDLPLMSDPDCIAVMDVLTTLLPPALHTDGNLFTLVVCRMVEVSLEKGNHDGSCLGYVWFGLLLGPRTGEYAGGYHFGKLGLDLVERKGLERYKARVYLEYFHVATPWKLPLRSAPALAQRALEVAAERGDLTFMAYASTNVVSALLASGRPLAEVQEEAESRLELAGSARFGMIEDIIAGQLALIRLLRGVTPDFNVQRQGRDDEAFERHLEEDPGMAVARAWYWVRKLQALYHTGDFPGALAAADKAGGVLWTVPTHLEVFEYDFFAGLACCACYATAPASAQEGLVAAAARHLAQYRAWEAALSAENFGDRAAILGAEVARLEGRELESEQLYERGLAIARENGQLQNEALAYELASRFYRVRGFRTFADSYLRLAISRYHRWGAEGKVRRLQQQATWHAGGLGNGSAIASVDAITMMKASQAISREIILSHLLDTLMRVVLQNAGAQKGCLVLLEGEEMAVAAQAGLQGEQVAVLPQPGSPLEELVPVSLVNYVRRTQETVILDDAVESDRLSQDPYALRNRPVSILCLPVLRQSEILGVLYLENNLVRGAFTEDRVTVLEALAAQAAISLESSRLYAALQESEEKYRQLSESLEERVKEAVEEVGEKNKMLVLQSRQAIMGEMLGNIAHQWRQPLNSLALLAQELQMTSKFDTLTKEDLEANVKKTMEIIQHMSKTIDDFRYFFKPEKEKVPFKLMDVLGKALSLLEGTFHAYQIEVETVATGDPALEGYPNEYSQVLLNILNNAKDAFLSRNVPEPRIVINAWTEGKKTVVTIADNGGGISGQIMEKIFDLYFTTKGPEHGTGVGLFMCKNIIEKNMGGSLTVRNTEQGAEFRIEV